LFSTRDSIGGAGDDAKPGVVAGLLEQAKTE